MSRDDVIGERIDPITGVKVSEYAEESQEVGESADSPEEGGSSGTKTWEGGQYDREESRKRLLEAISLSFTNISRGWKIYRRSLLAILGLMMVISVSLVAVFADEVASQHPYRNLTDTEDKWSNNPDQQELPPFSEECSLRSQKITTNPNSPLFSETVVAESANKVSGSLAYGYYTDVLSVTKIVKIEDTRGYDQDLSLITVDPDNSSIFVLSPDLYGNSSHYAGVWITYLYENQEMSHWWMPDGYDTCIFGTNKEGHDVFSKVVYGARVSLTIGITVATLTVSIGTIVGSISGYYGGRVDEVIMRICDVFFAIPGLILAMAFVAAMRSVSSLTFPVWLGVLLPVLLLAYFLHAHLSTTVLVGGEQVSDKAMGLLMRNRAPLVGLLAFLFFVGWLPAVAWPDFFGVSHDREWRLFSSLAVIVLLSAILLADRRLLQGERFDGAIGRLGSSFDWTNPWRYLNFRTVVVFISMAILFKLSGNEGSEIVLIKDFDKLWQVQFALIFTGWPGYARLIRGQVLYVKEMAFVEAARSVGAPAGRIMFRHILPNAWAPLLVAFTLDIGGTILSASGLSFLGLGAAPYTAEWGLMISESRVAFQRAPHMMLYPGLAIAVTVLGFNLIGDGIRDVVDPKNRR
tara:strand:- start:2050 stop:3948 length:1899 start_codon:yes stop_codon:yes gene_type:complete